MESANTWQITRLKVDTQNGVFQVLRKINAWNISVFLHKFINQFDLPALSRAALSRAFERCKIKVIEFFWNFIEVI